MDDLETSKLESESESEMRTRMRMRFGMKLIGWLAGWLNLNVMYVGMVWYDRYQL